MMNNCGESCWKVIDKGTHFLIGCERPRCHIQISFGDTEHNIPNYGTKDQSRADAETMCAALNARDYALTTP